MREIRNRWIVVTLLLILGASSASAQRDATVGGTVVDENGERLAGVVITVTSKMESRTDTSNKKGRFRIIVMDATEDFVLRAELEGYETVERRINLGVGKDLNESVTMVVAQARQTTEEFEQSSQAAAAYNEGATAFNNGDYAAARGHFEQALSFDPDPQVTLASQKVLTLVYFQLQEWELAAQSAEHVVAVEPDNDAALTVGFDSASRIGKNDLAKAFLDQLIIALPEGPATAARVFNFGVVENRAGKRDEAVRRFEQAITIDPTLGAAYTGLAALHLEAEEFDQALEISQRLLEIDEKNAEALGIRYEAFRRKGDEANMAAALEQLQSADPERIVAAFFQQGVLRFNEGNNEGAIEAFERVLAADPEYARAHYQLGRVFLSAGDLPRAKTELETFIAMAPDDPEVPVAQEMLKYLE
jgi:tetratricopeptide (TPR) repeat protein